MFNQRAPHAPILCSVKLSRTLFRTCPFSSPLCLLPPTKGDLDDTIAPVSVKRKKEVFLPPSGCHNSTQAEKEKRGGFRDIRDINIARSAGSTYAKI